MPELISLTEAARRVGVKVKVLTNQVFFGNIDKDICPKVGGIRVVPVTYLPVIRKLPAVQRARQKQLAAVKGG